MLIHEDWPTYKADKLVDKRADQEITWTISLIENIRSVRSEMNVNAGAKTDMVLLDLSCDKRVALDDNLIMIKRLADKMRIVQAEALMAVLSFAINFIVRPNYGTSQIHKNGRWRC